MDWHTNPDQHLPIVAYTEQDYYSSGQAIKGGFHSISPDESNWVGIYQFDEAQPFDIGDSLGIYQYLPADQGSGSFALPASWTAQLSPGQLYILKFANGANGIGNTELGTSHPFYRLD